MSERTDAVAASAHPEAVGSLRRQAHPDVWDARRVERATVEQGAEASPATPRRCWRRRRARAQDRPGSDATFVSCAAVRLIAPIKNDIGEPVVTGNRATLWHAPRPVGVDDAVPGYGRLLEAQVRRPSGHAGNPMAVSEPRAVRPVASRSFGHPASGRIAVKVIKQLGARRRRSFGRDDRRADHGKIASGNWPRKVAPS